MFSIKKLSVMLFIASALTLSTGCSAEADSCSTNSDCLASQYCATGGGVLFQSGQCLDRSAETDQLTDVESVQQDQDVENSERPDTSQTDTADETSEHGTPTGQQCENDKHCLPDDDNLSEPIEVSPCTFDSSCTNSSSRVIQEETFSCHNKLCYVNTEQKTEACPDDTRDTTGDICDETPAEIVWDDCEYASECSQSATVYGTLTQKSCQEEMCSQEQTNTVGPNQTHCNRVTNGKPCGENGTCNKGKCMLEAVPAEPKDPEDKLDL